MRTKSQILILAAVIGCTPAALRPAAAAPSPSQPDAPPAVGKPVNPEMRPSTPEDEALKRLIGQRASHKGIALSSGPIARAHKVLGKVSVEAAAPKGGADTKAGPNLYMNELLRKRAVELYGETSVDGIMNISYEPVAEGKLRANGTAVQFEKKQ
jgi:hypothetical protein